MSHPSPTTRRGSISSMLSDSTYHSFQEAELFEPIKSSAKSKISAPTTPKLASSVSTTDDFESAPMRRHDSGYESMQSRSRSSRRQPSTTSSATSNPTSRPWPRPRPRTRISERISPKPGPVAHIPRSAAPGFRRTRSHLTPPTYAHSLTSQSPTTYFHFPAMPDPAEEVEEVPLGQRDAKSALATNLDNACRPSPQRVTVTNLDSPTSPYDPPLPPQTTHYWTSDHTRRLEYAAIDAASRGVTGWMLRHVVPDCFIPKSKKGQHLGFEDDTGSVRRYRLDLDEEDVGRDAEAENGASKPKRWPLWRATTT